MFTPAARPPRIGTLIVLSGLSVLALNMFLPSLPAMAAEFGVSYARISLAVSGFFALTAVLQLVVGPLSDRVGRRPVILGGLGLFALASLVCTLARTDTAFLTARVVQCAVVVGSALSPAVVRDMAGPQEAARILGRIGMVMALAPMLGPLVGGLTDAALGWRWNFALYTLMGVAALGLAWSDLGETRPPLFAAPAGRSRAYLELMRSARFWSNALCLAFSAATFYLFLAGAPLVAASHFGLSGAWVGIAMAVTPIGFMAGNFLTTRLAGRLSLATLMTLGRAITVLGLSLAVAAALADPPAGLYFGLMVTVGIGNGLSFPPGYAGVMSVRPDLAGSASGLSGALMVAMGAVVTALATQILSPRNATVSLPVLMLSVAAAALAAALGARRVERAESGRALEGGPD